MKLSLLVSSPPSQSTAARMRIWRSLKSNGAATLRDGVYLLPGIHSEKFDTVIDDHFNENGHAYIFHAEAPAHLDLGQLFDRSEEYEELRTEISQIQSKLEESKKKEYLKQIRKLRKSINSLVEIDFFPNIQQSKTLNELTRLEHAIARLGEDDEPNNFEQQIKVLFKQDFQNKIWATRKRPWVDRLASAWIIQKFVDPQAEFIWLEHPDDCPKDALGFDFDHAKFTHINNLVTYEVLMHSFKLQNPALNKIAEIVHFLDVGGNEPAEALGIEKILQGLRSTITNDDQLLQLSNHIFDGLYADFQRNLA
ncbi:chromate resistance protein ChrB domain-containing protein [Acinetobacter johnsonii]|uniref:chromate resistance protein ChrB domain-containing protein n=1 Tax=Acinetobacter johnsonii TaxID=40214 RepID=UPI0013B407B5|nr:chromate resistance protein ChrB domain-containing protein [Acinetobacter johnsonii]MDH1278810.1 chromate resistance protein [Acinetobacter johnsonii]MDQ8975728.1 chromate resistance protein [Acinetobacter johnsonii]